MLRAVAVTFLFIVLALGTMAMILNTESGSRFVVRRIVEEVPLLHLEGVGGTLWRTLTVAELRFGNDAIDVGATNVEVALNWPSAIAGNLVLNRFRATTVDVKNLKPRPAEQRPFDVSMPPSPVAIAVRNGAVGQLTVPGGEAGLSISELRFRGATLVGSRVYADELSATLFETGFSLTRAGVTLSGDVPVVASVEWQRDDWAGGGRLGGTLAAIEIHHELAAPVAVTTSGTVSLQGRLQPGFDLAFAFQRIEAGTFSLADADIEVAGTVDDYRTTFDLAIAEERIPGIRLRGSGAGNRDGLNQGSYEIETGAGVATATGPVRWRPAPWAKLAFATAAFDPAFVDERMAGSLAARGEIEFAGANDWRVTNAELGGLLNAYSVNAAGNLAASPVGPRCDGCTARIASSADRPFTVDLGLDGTASSLDVDARGRIADLVTFEASGSLSAGAAGLGGTVNRAAIEEAYTGRSVL
ncbi:MAG: hypothetical protein OEV41_06890, partial [Gammaproteobacteria bacterium]|nr:hypothetical protein [Gammaproteobacteria bacterium]